MEIWIDYRENHLIAHIPNEELKYSWVTKTLHAGDIAIMYRGCVLCLIERKTWGDLADTFKGSRKFNYLKMLEEQKTSGCRVFYLIEGHKPPRTHRIDSTTLQAHLDHLMFDFNINIVYTSGLSQTLARCEELAKNFASSKIQPLKFIDDNLQGTVEPTVDKPKQNPTAAEFKLWEVIGGINATNYPLVKDKCTLIDLIEGKVAKDTLSNIVYPSGVLIRAKTAEKIYSSAQTPETQIKILAAVHGCSQTIANTLIQHFGSIPNLINQPQATIAAISNGKRTIGNALAAKILDTFKTPTTAKTSIQELLQLTKI